MPDRDTVISRIETICEICKTNKWRTEFDSDTIYPLLTDALALLKEQELGHWVFLTDCSNSGVYCSECNTKVFDSYPFKKKFSYFCPHCGTRMEGEIERR